MSAKFPYQRFNTETYRVLEICNKILPVLELLEPSKGHLRARDVLLRVLEVFDQRLLVPGDPLRDVRLRVREAFRLASLAAEEPVCRQKEKIKKRKHETRSEGACKREESGNAPVQVRSDLVRSTSLNSVALGTAGLEETSTFLSVAYTKRKFL